MPAGSREFDVRHLAALARLTLSPDDELLFSQQLADILEFAAEVKAVDTAGVPPTTHELAPPMRERPDEPGPSLARDEAVGNAPDARHGLFCVPRVLG